MVETCPICGKGIMSGALCPKYGQSVHQDHCFSCEHFQEIIFRCNFRDELYAMHKEKRAKEIRQKIAEFYKRHGVVEGIKKDRCILAADNTQKNKLFIIIVRNQEKSKS